MVRSSRFLDFPVIRVHDFEFSNFNVKDYTKIDKLFHMGLEQTFYNTVFISKLRLYESMNGTDRCVDGTSDHFVHLTNLNSSIRSPLVQKLSLLQVKVEIKMSELGENGTMAGETSRLEVHACPHSTPLLLRRHPFIENVILVPIVPRTLIKCDLYGK